MLKKLLIFLGVAALALVALQTFFPGTQWINILGVLSLFMIVAAPILLVVMLIREALRKRQK